MKITRFNTLDFIPASHEDPKDPGALKKVLLTRDDIPAGRLQMINWARIPLGKAFAPHYHEAMVELFIILNGRVKAKVDREEKVLEKGDLLIVNKGQTHSMENISEEEVDYIAMGIVTAEGGKTITLK